MSREAGDDPPRDVRRQKDLDGLDLFATTDLKSLITHTWRDNAEDWVGGSAPAWVRREALENEGLGGDDEDLPPVSANVDEEDDDQKCRKRTEDDEEGPIARHMLKSVAHRTVGVTRERGAAARARCTPG